MDNNASLLCWLLRCSRRWKPCGKCARTERRRQANVGQARFGRTPTLAHHHPEGRVAPDPQQPSSQVQHQQWAAQLQAGARAASLQLLQLKLEAAAPGGPATTTDCCWCCCSGCRCWCCNNWCRCLRCNNWRNNWRRCYNWCGTCSFRCWWNSAAWCT